MARGAVSPIPMVEFCPHLPPPTKMSIFSAGNAFYKHLGLKSKKGATLPQLVINITDLVPEERSQGEY